MGNEANVEAFIKPLRQLPKTIRAARPAGLKAVAADAKLQFLSAPGAPHVIAKRPVRVYTKVTETNALIGWGQSARLVNDPTEAHIIRPRGSGSAKNQGRYLRRTGQVKSSIRALAVVSFLGAMSGTEQQGAGGGYSGRHGIRIGSGGPIRAFARHPGTRGKHFVEKGKRQAMERAPQVYAAEHRAAIARSFNISR